MTEKLYIQLGEDTGVEVFEAAERIAWYIPEKTARYIAREAIIVAYELTDMLGEKISERQEYLRGFLNDLLRQSGAGDKYIIKPANKEGDEQ